VINQVAVGITFVALRTRTLRQKDDYSSRTIASIADVTR
jgi:hypothetical protein